MHAWFDHRVQEAPHIWSFYFRPTKEVRAVAGQFIELTLPHEKPDTRGINRWFTLSNAQSSPLLRITMRIVPDCSSFKQALLDLPKASVVHIAEPMGDFVLPKDTTLPIVCVAAGIGITPFIAMVSDMTQRGQKRHMSVLWAVESEDDIIFQDVFAAQNIHPIIIVSHPTDAWGGERGHITADHILALSQPTNQSRYFLAGPEQLVEALTHDLRAKHIPAARIITDYFPGY